MAPIHSAVLRGDLEEVKRLIRADATLISQRLDGYMFVEGRYGLPKGMPLHIASLKNDVEMVKYLLDHGADLYSKDNGGKDALYHAISHRHLDIASLLLERGANPASQQNDRKSALMVACENGDDRMARLLLDNGADPNARQDYGYDVLLYACLHGHLAVVCLLLERGASVRERYDHDRTTTLILASRGGHVDVVKCLLDHGGRQILNAMTTYSNSTALHYSCSAGHPIVTKMLLDAGADPRLADTEGETPLDTAQRRHNHQDIALIQAALAEPERVRWLHKARLLNDAEHVITKRMSEGEGLTEGEKKQKILAAAPAYLKGRVERGEELPKVEIGRREEKKEKEDEEEENEDVTLAVLKRVVIGGVMAKELYVDVMDYMVPAWDDARTM